MANHQDSNTTSRRVLSRRTVVRTAAHSAWMVPAISIVTAAPALAAQSAGATQTITGGSGTWGTVTHVTGNTYTFTNWAVSGIVVTNTAATDTATGITVTINFASATYQPSTQLTPTATGAGWTFSAGSSTPTSYVFNYGSTLAPGASAPALGATFGFSGTGSKPSGEVVSATAAASVSGSPGTTYNAPSQPITTSN